MLGTGRPCCRGMPGTHAAPQPRKAFFRLRCHAVDVVCASAMDSSVVVADIARRRLHSTRPTQRLDHLLTSAVVETIDTGPASSSRAFFRSAVDAGRACARLHICYSTRRSGVGAGSTCSRIDGACHVAVKSMLSSRCSGNRRKSRVRRSFDLGLPRAAYAKRTSSRSALAGSC